MTWTVADVTSRGMTLRDDLGCERCYYYAGGRPRNVDALRGQVLVGDHPHLFIGDRLLARIETSTGPRQAVRFTVAEV